MPGVLVRNLSEETLVGLKARAVANGRSLQQEVKAILVEAAAGRPADALALAARMREKLRSRLAGGTDSVDLQREDRER
jgi:plasmid stability protein